MKPVFKIPIAVIPVRLLSTTWRSVSLVGQRIDRARREMRSSRVAHGTLRENLQSSVASATRRCFTTRFHA